MPLRDHYKPPLVPFFQWESFHGQWAASIVRELNRKVLPSGYIAAPFISLQGGIQVDVGTLQGEELGEPERSQAVAVLPYAPPKAQLSAQVAFTGLQTFEVQVLAEGTGRLAAAIELVSRANKDRPANRDAFSIKCLSYLQQGTSVIVVDLVTDRRGNFLRAVLDSLGAETEGLELADLLYAGALRTLKDQAKTVRMEAWFEDLEVGAPLPELPLWLAVDLAVPLNLEESYQATCEALRLP
jgi:hypothetical protein